MSKPSEPVIFESPRWIAALYHALCFMCLGLAALVLWLLVPSWDGIDAVFGVVFLIGPLVGIGIMILLHAQRVAGSRIVLDPDSITLRLPGYGGWMYMQKVAEHRHAWTDVKGVAKRRRQYGAAGHGTDITEFLIEAGGEVHVLTRTFIRDPQAAAEAIADAAGRGIRDLGFERRGGLPSKE